MRVGIPARAEGLAKAKTPEAYLRVRGIDLIPPASAIIPRRTARGLRSQRVDEHGKRRFLFPNAAVMFNPILGKGGYQAAHCTLLNAATTAKIDAKGSRIIHGSKKGGFIPLSDDTGMGDTLVVGEGVETALSAMQLTGHPGAAFIDAGNATYAALPPSKKLIVARDRGEAGRAAADTLVRRYGPYREVAIVAPPKGAGNDFNDALQSGTSPELLKRRLLKAKLMEAVEVDFDWAPTMADFKRMDIPPAVCILDPILRMPGSSMLSARAGHMKTRLALSIAHAAATGTDLMDWKVDRPLYRVLYVDAELTAQTMIEWLNRLGPDAENLRILSDKLLAAMGKKERVTMATKAGRAFVTDTVVQFNPEFIIMDFLFQLAPASGQG